MCREITRNEYLRHAPRSLRSVVEVRAKPAFDRLKIQALALLVVKNLIARDFADCEISRCGMRKVEAADRRSGNHRHRFGQANTCILLSVQQPENGLLLGVVRQRGIARRGANAAIAFV